MRSVAGDQPEHEDASDPLGPDAAQKQILIIEDDPDCRIELRLLLEELGYKVLQAPDARTGLRLAEEHGPGLIVQDLLLPDTHGFDLVRQLRALPGGETRPIIALSAFPDRLSEARATALGFNSFIRKPPPVAALCTLIEKLLASQLGSRRPERANRARRSSGVALVTGKPYSDPMS